MTTTSKSRLRRNIKRREPKRVSAKPAAPLRTRRVLVATDGSEPANAALRLARLYADRGDWMPDVVTVTEPIPVYVGDLGMPLPSPDQELLVRNSVAERIGEQVRRFGSGSWDLAIEFGRTPPSIVRAASKRSAELIVVGLGSHGKLARLFGAETAARVARHADVPVLAVHPKTTQLPRIAVVAIDFGPSSLRAAQEALTLLAPPGRLHLVHVRWGMNLTTLPQEDWERAYESGAERALSRVIDQLDHREGIEITTELAAGVLTSALLSVTKASKADVIALGRHGESTFDRFVIGSTPTQILRTAGCSVLVAPEGKASSSSRTK